MESYRWVPPLHAALYAVQWRRLLEWASDSAQEVRWSVAVAPRVELRLGARWPPIRLLRAPEGSAVLERLRVQLGPARRVVRSRERWGESQRFESLHVAYPLTPRVRRYLMDAARYPESWDQLSGLPEDPTLLATGRVLLETVSHEAEVFLRLTGTEARELEGEGFVLVRV